MLNKWSPTKHHGWRDIVFVPRIGSSPLCFVFNIRIQKRALQAQSPNLKLGSKRGKQSKSLRIDKILNICKELIPLEIVCKRDIQSGRYIKEMCQGCI